MARATAMMATTAACTALLVCVSLLGPLPPPLMRPLAAQATSPLDHIAVHDNRTPAGSVSRGALEVRLEARRGQWFPDGEDKPGVAVKAFGIEGGPLQVPGPLIRVREGTEVRAIISNRTGSEPLALHGLYSRPATTADPAVVIPPGETREVRFSLARAGTYFYWGATAAETPLPQRAPSDTQLAGAIVVDPADGPVPDDRVLVIGYWNNGVAVGAAGATHERYRYVINGRSWPATERLGARVGQTVRMRLVNAGANVHPMHLHGFYFNVDSRGTEWTDDALAPGASPRLVVTERLEPARSFSLSWAPTRPGNWLFHCHDNAHLDPGGALGDATANGTAVRDHLDDHATAMMAGPVMGITVTGTSTEPPEPRGRRRTLHLTARLDEGGTAEEPAFGYTLDEGRTATPARPPYLPGPTILLKRGEPVSITVHNALPEPTAVHWHGIELESYYDGVAGFAGDGTRVAPAIAPGGSFEARFTPPRAGTFIYHTHLDDTRQQRAGLSGPLLVVEDPTTYDPEHDLVFLITVPRKAVDSATALVNGSSTPPGRTLRVGERYRLRFINAHTFRPSMRMRILRGDAPLRWRAVAKDGMELPTDRAVDGPSEVQMGNGETYDFEFVPDGPGDLHLDVTTGGGVVLASMPMRVR